MFSKVLLSALVHWFSIKEDQPNFHPCYHGNHYGSVYEQDKTTFFDCTAFPDAVIMILRTPHQ